MAALFADGRILDAVLALVALEAAALLVLRRRLGRGPSVATLLANLASGACLMLALRLALTGFDWMPIAGLMLGSLAAHLADLWLRFRDELQRSLGRSAVSGPAGTSPEKTALPAGRQAGIILP